MPRPGPTRLLLACAAVLGLAGCGGVSVTGEGPEPTAIAFQEAWTAGDCEQALSHVTKVDANWTASCRDAHTFAIACDRTASAPKGQECGKGTVITVTEAEATRTTYDDSGATVSVKVAYDVGSRSHKQKTYAVVLQEADDGWQVVGTG